MQGDDIERVTVPAAAGITTRLEVVHLFVTVNEVCCVTDRRPIVHATEADPPLPVVCTCQDQDTVPLLPTALAEPSKDRGVRHVE